MAFEMVTGRKARRGRSAVEIAHQVVNEPAPDPRDVEPGRPGGRRRGDPRRNGARPADRPADGRRAGRPARATAACEHARAASPPFTPRTTPAGRTIVRPAARGTRWAAVAGAGGARGGGASRSRSSAGGGRRLVARARRHAGRRAEQAERKQTTRPRDAPAIADEAAGGRGRGAGARAQEPPPLDGVPAADRQPGGRRAEAERSTWRATPRSRRATTTSAIDLNTQAIEAFPEGTTWEDDINYAYALYSLGSALRLAGRPEEAIPVLEARRAIPDQTETVQHELDLARQEAGE